MPTSPHRALLSGQTCSIRVYDSETDATTEIYRTYALLLEAPNWLTPDTLLLNGDGVLWTLDIATATQASGALKQLDLPPLPFLNNDHVPSPDGDTLFVSGYDWHIHAVSLSDKTSRQVTRDDPVRPMRHFLHGVSPDGRELAFVGVEPVADSPWGAANIFTLPVQGGAIRQLTEDHRPSDGCEYAPGGRWIYFNSAMFSDVPGHAQIARMPSTGGAIEQLTFDGSVNWFPHIAPQGNLACYLSYPPGTIGHPENRPVELKLVRDHDWLNARTVARLFGGQGTINVNSWSPDGRSFAFVAYPMDR